MERTSLTHPLRIAKLKVGGGYLGITICPGKSGFSQTDPDNPWKRDVHDDMDCIAMWGAKSVLTLLEDDEMVRLGVAQEGMLPALAREALSRKMSWLHVPIKDRQVPGEVEFASVLHIGAKHAESIRGGERLLVHCNGGLGRAGMVAAILLVTWGERPGRAIERVRHVRGPGAIETKAQEEMVYLAAQRFSS